MGYTFVAANAAWGSEGGSTEETETIIVDEGGGEDGQDCVIHGPSGRGNDHGYETLISGVRATRGPPFALAQPAFVSDPE